MAAAVVRVRSGMPPMAQAAAAARLVVQAAALAVHLQAVEHSDRLVLAALV